MLYVINGAGTPSSQNHGLLAQEMDFRSAQSFLKTAQRVSWDVAKHPTTHWNMGTFFYMLEHGERLGVTLTGVTLAASVACCAYASWKKTPVHLPFEVSAVSRFCNTVSIGYKACENFGVQSVGTLQNIPLSAWTAAGTMACAGVAYLREAYYEKRSTQPDHWVKDPRTYWGWSEIFMFGGAPIESLIVGIGLAKALLEKPVNEEAPVTSFQDFFQKHITSHRLYGFSFLLAAIHTYVSGGSAIPDVPSALIYPLIGTGYFACDAKKNPSFMPDLFKVVAKQIVKIPKLICGKPHLVPLPAPCVRRIKKLPFNGPAPNSRHSQPRQPKARLKKQRARGRSP